MSFLSKKRKHHTTEKEIDKCHPEAPDGFSSVCEHSAKLSLNYDKVCHSAA